MKKIDWVRVLTSRKFWMSIASFITMLLIVEEQSENVATWVISLIMAGATVIDHVLGEGLADTAHVNNGEGEERKTHEQDL